MAGEFDVKELADVRHSGVNVNMASVHTLIISQLNWDSSGSFEAIAVVFRFRDKSYRNVIASSHITNEGIHDSKRTVELGLIAKHAISTGSSASQSHSKSHSCSAWCSTDCSPLYSCVIKLD